MPKSTALLITCDLTLVQAVSQVIEPIDGLAVMTVATASEASPHLHRAGLALLLAHLARAGDAAGLLEPGPASPRPLRALVISNRRQADRALALLPQGAADSLARPLDLGRLGYLTDVLPVRARHTVSRAEAAPGPDRAEGAGE